MAKYKGGLAGTISGTVGGSTFSKDGTLRNKPNPSNKQTQAQLNQRGLQTLISQAWRSITEANRLAWNSVGAAFSITDVFGDTLPLKGIALYSKLNQNLMQVGSPMIDVPPNPTGGGEAPTLSSLAAAAGAGTLSLAYTPTPQPTGYALQVWATVGKSAGVKFVGSSYKLISIVQPADASPLAMGTDYTDVFGSMIEGTTIFVKVQSINVATGETGSIQTISTVVAA